MREGLPSDVTEECGVGLMKCEELAAHVISFTIL